MSYDDHEEFTPRWQSITGITDGETEAEMPRGEHDQRMWALLKEVETLAFHEFKRAIEDKENVRSPYWDPIDYICRNLGISRVHLSRITIELVGLRAHEVTDRMKGVSLPPLITKWVDRGFEAMREKLKKMFTPEEAAKPGAFDECVKAVLKALKHARSGNYAVAWACEMGFANPSRAHKACVNAYKTSVGDFEERRVRTLVQKFLESQIASEASAVPATTKAQSHEDTKKEERKEQPVPVERLKALQKELGLGENLSPEDEKTLTQLLKEQVA